jgi:hypothetical protein
MAAFNQFFALFLGTILVAYLFTEYSKPNFNTLNKDVQYYDNLKPTTDLVISDKLKDPNTLEQEMVNNMVAITKSDYPRYTPRYQPVLSNSLGSTDIE